MIKHWEIVENKWTQDAAYVLCIVGEESDAALISKELSSFCNLVDIKVSSFNYIFELLNVTDDDILQKIRTRIEEIVAKSSAKDKSSSLSAGPVRVSEGGLAFSTEDLSGDNLIIRSSSEGDGLSSSSDGLQISIEEAKSSKIEETKTHNIGPIVNNLQEEQPNIVVPQPVKEVPAPQKVQPVKEVKEEKVGFFKRLFSFGKKKEIEPKKQEKVSEPLPIETQNTKVKNIVPNKADTLRLPAKDVKKHEPAEDKKNTMHGVVVKGTAFPTKEMGIQDVKEVSLDSKPLFDKEQSNDKAPLESQVPLDDIFAAETICQFYDEGRDAASEPKIEKIVEPTPMPTPQIIPITRNKILEEKLNKPAEENKVQQETVNNVSATPVEQKPLEPAAQVPPPAAKPVIPAAPIKTSASQKPAEEVKPAIPQASVAPIQQKDATNQEVQTAKPVAPQAPLSEPVNTEKKIRKDIPTLSISEEETFKVKNPLVQEQSKTSLPKVEVDSKDLGQNMASLSKEAAVVAATLASAPKPAEVKAAQTPKVEKKVESAPKKENKVAQPKQSAKQQRPITMPPIDKTTIDGFDHTIQTSSIPVYKKSNWSIEMPIIPSYTLDNWDMSSNRFAHAAAMSVIENPGTMLNYNPFFVFGESGCGKTHFLNAMGVEFSKKLSQDKIFITNGVRFSRGVQRSIEDGSIEKVRGFLDEAQVLIIDDIHLTAVNDSNREFISQVLNDFVNKRKQLIISSKYPPQGLSRFEELTDFKLSQGWVSELKTLRPSHFIKTYTKMAEDAQVDLTEAQCRGFFGREGLTLGMINRDIKRAKVLRRRIKDSGSMLMSYEQLFNYITAITGEDTTSQLETLDLSSPLSIRRGENTNWGNFGFFFPKESADKFKWIVYATMRRAKELGIKGGFNFALKSAYSTEHIIASAFKIANVCDSKSLKAAIILGPDPKIIQPAIRDNFCDILSHMLEVMMIRCAIIPYEDIKKPSSYAKVLGDVLK
jgi:ATPase involved in DNA replication initiation